MKPRPRPIGRFDLIQLGIVAVLSLASGVVADREQAAQQSFNASFVEQIENRSWSHLPAWARKLWQPSGRLLVDGFALLAAAGPGLAWVAYRPGRGMRRGRSGPGHIALWIAVGVFAGFAVVVALERWVSPLIVLPPGTSRGTPVGPPMEWANFSYRPALQIPWMILGAWSYLALTRQWRPPIDLADRLGRWLGWLWFGLMGWQGFVTMLFHL
ncbi:hypothetical protein P12x_005720 [Tundrisphaera lichenicola]|uniref:hypothetical protein n=1 Tax=Tundrisphaera lichenicola TaxID=2029860 RepID=UPI003EBD1C2C